MTQSYADSINLFDQAYTLQVETLQISQLHIEFEVKRSLSAKVANSAEIKIFNLSQDTRKKLQGMRDVFVSLEAGYAQGQSLIYRGDLREAWSTKDGNDWITVLSSADSAKKRKKKRINKSFSAGTSVTAIIVACAKALQVGLGNSEKKAAGAKLWDGQSASFTTGYVASGDAVSQLDRVCRSCGIEWSIQDGQLQLLDRGRALQEKGILLTAKSGLLDSPELGKGNVVRCRSSMIPGLYPGRRVEVQSRHVNGVYRIETTHHKGTYETPDWGAELELKVPKP